ncbi:MAG: PilN domain-containing protein [Bdellovibrionales bacterium]|nr:PilN domain-containing protein [Bdellovibrionales bacterium]
MTRKHVNFIPKDLRPKMEIPHEILPYALVGFALFYMVLGPVRISLQTKSGQEELAALQTTRDELEKKVKSLADDGKLAQQSSESFRAIERVLGRKNYWSEIFKEMSMLIPDGVWLTNFTHQGLKSGTKNPEQLLVKGEATSQMGMVKFLTILENSHYFAGARLISSERMRDIKPPKFKFEFTIPVKAENGGKG